MKKLKQQKPVSQKTYASIQAYIGQHNEIIGIEVRGKWLVASLKSGVNFSVRNV